MRTTRKAARLPMNKSTSTAPASSIRLIIFCAALALLAGGFFLMHASNPDRALARSWDEFIANIEGRDAPATAAFLAADYTDSWGYTQQTLPPDLRRMMRYFKQLKLALSDVTIERTGPGAVITAKVRMSASGYGYVDDAMHQINALEGPFVLHWKREGRLPWKWRVSRVEQPQFDPSRYGIRKTSPLMWPF